MKKLYSLLTLFFLTVTVLAQSPQKMSYQAVVRNNDNSLVINQSVGVKISILQGSGNGTTVFSELFNPNPETNANGLLTLEIGGGVPVSGTFSEIDWSKGPFFIRTEIDPSGGSNYTVTGTTSLLSVPFALHAQSVENDKVDDADNDPANEIQQLNLSGTTLSLSKGGGSVTLPTSGEGGSDNWGTQSVVSDATLDGAGTSASPLKLADNAVTSAKIVDGAVTGSKIESGAISSDKIETGAVTGIKIAQSGASSGQVLKWDGAQWSPGEDESGEGGFSLPFEGSVSTTSTVFSIINTNDFPEGNGARFETSSMVGYGIYGKANNSSLGGAIGVIGESANLIGDGVRGISTAGGINNEGNGVRGVTYSGRGHGVLGLAYKISGQNFGVLGESRSSSGTGVKGIATSTSGGTFGVHGETASNEGRGVYGVATSAAGLTYGVFGLSQSYDGHGVYGEASSTSGNVYGVYGVSASSTGVGVYAVASHPTGDGVGVKGISEGQGGIGVSGRGRIGASGTSMISGGIGVHGINLNNHGINFGVMGNVNSNEGFSGHFRGGKFYVDGRVGLGTESPVTTLHVRHGTLAQNAPAPVEGIRIHNSGANNNSWTLYTVNSNGNLQFYANNTLRGTFSATSGTYTSSSNRRLKTDITALGEDILKRTLKLEPVSYRFISNPQSEPTIGFIAEDVQPLFPELVEVTGETGENLGVNYAAFSVVAIKAIQQQQKQMEALQTENGQLKKQMNVLNAENERIKKRMEQLEAFMVSAMNQNK